MAEDRDQHAPDALPPSPWRVDPDYRPGMEWNNHILSADGNTVCFMAHDPDDNTKLENAAHIIAAAPDLYEALQEVRGIISEAAATGFNCREGDWAERLFSSQARSFLAVRKATPAASQQEKR